MTPQKQLKLREYLQINGVTKGTLDYFTGSFDELLALLDQPLSAPEVQGDLTVRRIGDSGYYFLTNSKGENAGIILISQWNPDNPFDGLKRNP